jgi:hypothetical protein
LEPDLDARDRHLGEGDGLREVGSLRGREVQGRGDRAYLGQAREVRQPGAVVVRQVVVELAQRATGAAPSSGPSGSWSTRHHSVTT